MNNNDVIALYDGTILQTHPPTACVGQHCCIHNPSNHPLRTAPLTWFPSVQCMGRVCVHQQMHPDPDDLVFRDFGVARRHRERDACCGCCHDD